MKKELLEKIEKKLKEEKSAAEKTLRGFARKDAEFRGDWDTIYPTLDRAPGGGGLETEADELQEYECKLDIEHTLELKLRDIDLALQKIKEGKYGLCEKCRKKISQQRLEIAPQARFCSKCQG